MIKTAHYKKECSCGDESVCKIQHEMNQPLIGGRWIRCAECGAINWSEKKT